MTNKPINLRLRRKQRARDEKRKQSDISTSTRGVTRTDRQLGASLSDLDAKRLDGRRLDTSERDDNA